VVKMGSKAVSVIKHGEKVWQKKRRKVEVKTDETLFDVLRALRKEIAERESVPPYIIFSDSTLREMCEHLPCDRSAMLKIKGVGELKMVKYGEDFIEVIMKHTSV